jgi:pSer/pThr/pTyr-binding forkhead associated (FHA) protein
MTEALRVRVSFRGAELLSRTFARDRILIGRDPACDLRLRNSDVSKRHACILRRGSLGYLLCDLGSTNGIFAGEDRISLFPIREGGRARIGRFDLDFRLIDVPWGQGEAESLSGEDDDAATIRGEPGSAPAVAQAQEIPERETTRSTRVHSRSALAVLKRLLPGARS